MKFSLPVSKGAPFGAGAISIAVAVLMLASSPALVSLNVYESFDYDPGALPGENGGTGWGSVWGSGGDLNPGNVLVVAGTLMYGDLQTGGGRVDLATLGGRTSIYRDLASTFGGAGSDIWLSFLIDAGSATATVNLFRSGTTPAQVFAGAALAPFYGVNYAGESVTSGFVPTNFGVAPGSGTHMLVLHLDMNTGGLPAYTAWLDPDATSLGTGAAPTGGGMTSVTTGTQDFTFDQVNLDEFTTASTVSIDEIRLGESWEEVSPIVPEPASAMLLLLGALAVLCGARRR